jgi:glycoside hydrolase-like protein
MLFGSSSRRVGGFGLLVVALTLLACVGAAHATPLKVVRYHGYAVKVPRSWTVYDLATDPRVCVRFNRHAVYLGAPRAQAQCPAHAIGRTEAISLAPATAAMRRALTRSTAGVAQMEGSATFLTQSGRVVVTATWFHHRAVVARALNRPSLHATATMARAAVHPAIAPRAASSRSAHPTAAVFGGLGFDACSAPSPTAMAAWGASPYRAIGIYIGGANRACPQANLTSTWIANEVAAGWHTIPVYVGLQAPSNSCGCAAMSPSQASAQGTAAAIDAVADAQGIGIPPGNPIYNDMESYSRTSTNTSAVLAFLSAWTAQLHAEGYLSGVYSSSGSGVSDLVTQFGTTFLEPDDIWFAEWNNQESVASAYIPAADWPDNQRLHQYRGGHNETYGGVTINIDSDFIDGATADTSGSIANVLPPPAPPKLRVSPAADGTTSLSMSYNGGNGVASWRVLAAPSTTAPLVGAGGGRSSGASSRIVVRSAAPAFAVQPLDSTGAVLATSATVATPPHIAVFGRSVFVPSGPGFGGIPVGCYQGVTCHVTTTVFAGRRTIATTAKERIGPNGTGIVYFKLTSTGRSLLNHARGHRLPINVRVQDATGTKAVVKLVLVPFTTSGTGPQRAATPAPPLRIVGRTNFVDSHGTGGILASCGSPTPCSVTTVVSVGRTVIARTGRELMGADELGYLIFTLTSRGRTLLAHAHGNQLGARVTITQTTPNVGSGSVSPTPTTVTASASVALVRFR